MMLALKACSRFGIRPWEWDSLPRGWQIQLIAFEIAEGALEAKKAGELSKLLF